MKALLIIITLALIGCGDLPPFPTEAVKACVDKGWRVHYFGNQHKAELVCTPVPDINEEGL